VGLELSKRFAQQNNHLKGDAILRVPVGTVEISTAHGPFPCRNRWEEEERAPPPPERREKGETPPPPPPPPQNPVRPRSHRRPDPPATTARGRRRSRGRLAAPSSPITASAGPPPPPASPLSLPATIFFFVADEPHPHNPKIHCSPVAHSILADAFSAAPPWRSPRRHRHRLGWWPTKVLVR
jgi:hypothetical protein